MRKIIRTYTHTDVQKYVMRTYAHTEAHALHLQLYTKLPNTHINMRTTHDCARTDSSAASAFRSPLPASFDIAICTSDESACICASICARATVSAHVQCARAHTDTHAHTHARTHFARDLLQLCRTVREREAHLAAHTPLAV